MWTWRGYHLELACHFQILPLVILENIPLVSTTIEVDNFSVLASCPSHELRLLESSFIHKFFPKLNNQASSFPLKILSWGITFFYGYIFSNSFNIINFHWFTIPVYLNSKICNLFITIYWSKMILRCESLKLSFKIKIIKICKLFFCAALVIYWL